MERAAHLTETLHPLKWAPDKTHLVQQTRTTLEKGTPVSIGMPRRIRYNHDEHWFVPVLVEGQEAYFVPQDSAYEED